MISIIHPSRGRAVKARKTYLHWINQVMNPDEIEYILSIDDNDPQLDEYLYQFRGYTIVQGENTCAVDAINRAAKECKGDIIIVISDDFECFQNWDETINGAFAIHKNKLLKTWDGTQMWIVTLPIMDRQFYEENGYIYFPKYKHMFCDTDLTHKAELEGKLLYRPSIQFIHRHYTTNESEKDEVSEKADSTWAQGEALYYQRVNECFGLENIADVWALQEVAQPHIAWCKLRMPA